MGNFLSITKDPQTDKATSLDRADCEIKMQTQNSLSFVNFY